MKKSLTILFLASALILLAGCQTAPEAQTGLSLKDVARQALKDPDAFIPYTAEDLYDLTGICPDNYTEAVFLRDQDTLSGREAIMIRAKNADAARAAKEALERYLSQRKEETRDYLPNAYHLLSDAKVESSGLTVSLIIQ